MSVARTGTSRTVWSLPSVVRSSRRPWERGYVRAVIGIDAVASLVAGVTAYDVRWLIPRPQDPRWGYVAFSAALPLLWLAAMAAARAYEARFLSVGFEEFRRVLVAAVVVIATVATASWATKAQIARGYILIALPMAAILTLLGRYLVRKWVHRQRRRGFFMSDVLLVGHGRTGAELVRQVRRDTHHGMRIVGACVPRRGGLRGPEGAGRAGPGRPGGRRLRPAGDRRGRRGRAAVPGDGRSRPADAVLEPGQVGDRPARGAGVDRRRRAPDRHPAGLRVAVAARRRTAAGGGPPRDEGAPRPAGGADLADRSRAAAGGDRAGHPAQQPRAGDLPAGPDGLAGA